MGDTWFYARKGQRFGPVPWAKVRSLAEQGWLMPGDLVWMPEMPDWQPAGSVKGLFKNSLVESLGSAVDGVIPGIRPAAPEAESTASGGRGRGVESSRGPHANLISLMARVISSIAQGRRQAAVRPLPPAAAGEPRRVPADYYGPGEHVTVINHPPMQRWSPALAAVLSFLVPGLGQLYKGQVLNGIVWFFVVGLGYLALLLPGFLLHFFCIVGAASGNPWTPGRTEVVRR